MIKYRVRFVILIKLRFPIQNFSHIRTGINREDIISLLSLNKTLHSIILQF